MKKSIWCVTILGAFASPVVADEKPGTSPAMVAAGIRAVSSLKTLPPGQNRPYYFAIMRGPDETIGYASVAITSKGIPGNVVYEYTNTWTIIFPTGDRVVSDLKATLRPNFEPIDVDVWEGRFMPDGQLVARQSHVAVGKEKTVVTTSNDGESQTRDLPQLEKPYVSAIEVFAAQHVPTPGERFVLREFDPKSGRTRDLLINTDALDDGTVSLITTTRDGNVSYQFWYDESDVLIRWTESGMPIMFVRVHKERMDELKAQFGEVKRPASVTQKGATEKSKP